MHVNNYLFEKWLILVIEVKNIPHPGIEPGPPG